MSVVPLLTAALALTAQAARQGSLQTAPFLLLEGATLVAGDGRQPLPNAALLLSNGAIAAIGTAGSLTPPAAAARVDLRGKFIIPALIDAHSHPGYTHIPTLTTAAASYTRETVVDHLRRYAHYGVAAALSLGLDRGELPYELRDAIIPGAARLLTAGRGIAWPGAGPLAEYWRDAAYGVTTAEQARAAVRELAARDVSLVKIWVDDRNGTVTKLPRPLSRVVIQEAHARGMRVVAHVYYQADAKDLLRDGVDGFAHGIRDVDVDDELVNLFRGRRQVFLLPNLPDGPLSADEIAWLEETLPDAQIARLRAAAPRTEAAQALFDRQLRNLRTLHAAGVRIGLGTDAGASFDGTGFGWTAHTELADMVAAGLTPAEALAAATRTSAEILGLDRLGTIAPGRSADLVVLDADPLADIRNTRRIARVYLRGVEIDRRWTK